jgi:hypothetical protein
MNPKIFFSLVLIAPLAACFHGPGSQGSGMKGGFETIAKSCESGLVNGYDQIESAESDFKARQKGMTPKMKESPEYKSMMASHDNGLERVSTVKAKQQELSSWAKKPESGQSQDEARRFGDRCQTMLSQLAEINMNYAIYKTTEMMVMSKYSN